MAEQALVSRRLLVAERADSAECTSEGVRRLQELIRGMSVSQMLGVACEVGLPDAVTENPTSLAAVGEGLGVNKEVLTRLARALSGFGVFEVSPEGLISHNDASRLLRSVSDPSLHWVARFWSSPGMWQAWGALSHCLRTGEEAFLPAHGDQFFAYMEANSQEQAVYQRYMAGGYPGRHEAIASSINLAECERVIDVGGGVGTLTRELLARHPISQGVVYDQASAIEAAAELPHDDRLSLIAGDFFESVPPGGDVYILSWILHDWPDEQAHHILRNCRDAMPPGARLVIVDRVLRDAVHECDPLDLLLDLQMLVLHGGRERTLHDFSKLLKAADFSAPIVVSERPEFSIVEARAV